ncbi:hypothetical protein AAUPMC_03699, partial [Pasteurella multocida subsp. multocida str. Anand1_cattle]
NPFICQQVSIDRLTFYIFVRMSQQVLHEMENEMSNKEQLH